MTRLVSEDFFHQIFEDVYYDGTPVRFIKNKFTGEIRIAANDVARVLGYETANDLLGTDGGLDAISDWKRDNPDKSVFGKYGKRRNSVE
jgi:prophage antirepressor-like protein